MPGDQAIDTALLNMLHIAKTKEVEFALVMKGGADGALLLERFKIPPQLIVAAKKRTGGSAVLHGRCFFEDGKYIFAMEKIPPATAAQVVKKVVKRDTELTIHAEFRFVAAKPAPGPSKEETAFTKQLADMRRQVEQAAAHSVQSADPLVKMLAKIDATPKTDRGRAQTLLQQLEKSYHEYTAWKPVNDRFADKFALLRTLPSSPAKKDINTKLREYGSRLASGSYSLARDSLELVEPAIDKLLSDAKVEVPPTSSSAAAEKPEAEINPSAHPLADWQAASKTAAGQVVQLLGVLRSTKIPALESMGHEMLATTRKYITAMQTVLAEYEHAAGDAKREAAKKSLELAKACKTRIPGEKLLVGADKNPFGVHATVCQTLGRSLDEVIAGLL